MCVQQLTHACTCQLGRFQTCWQSQYSSLESDLLFQKITDEWARVDARTPPIVSQFDGIEFACCLVCMASKIR